MKTFPTFSPLSRRRRVLCLRRLWRQNALEQIQQCVQQSQVQQQKPDKRRGRPAMGGGEYTAVDTRRRPARSGFGRGDHQHKIRGVQNAVGHGRGETSQPTNTKIKKNLWVGLVFLISFLRNHASKKLFVLSFCKSLYKTKN
jgi:hypothetical protein